MKPRTKNWVYSVAIWGVALVCIISCTKKEDNGNLPSTPTIVKDIDGNVYDTIKIGTQVWMIENLKTTKFNDGTSIPLVTDNLNWRDLTTPGYCWYANDAGSYKDTYGDYFGLYHATHFGVNRASDSGVNHASDSGVNRATHFGANHAILFC